MEDRKALYTSLRLGWLKDPTLAVEDWQVQDYREMPYGALFDVMRTLQHPMDRVTFVEYASQCESPDELTALLAPAAVGRRRDQLYLVVFELWRRLLSDKPCLSIFCDELDYHIALYDAGEVDNSEALENLLANLEILLEEGTDQGSEGLDVFLHVACHCAHDLEDFLLDFIAERMDEENFSYAGELLEMFSPYLPASKWLRFLQARHLAHNDLRAGYRMIRHLLDEEDDSEELDFYFDLLAFLSTEGDKPLFDKALHKCLRMVATEEDLLDLLNLCLDYHKTLDHKEEVLQLSRLIKNRDNTKGSRSLDALDPAIVYLRKAIVSINH